MKRILVIFIVTFIVVVIGYYIYTTIYFINKFHDLGKISKKETPYKPPQGFMIVKNILNQTKDTLYFKNKTIVNFWASWCKPCLAELPYFDSLALANNENLQIVIISFEDEKTQRKFLSKSLNSAYFIADSTQFLWHPKALPFTLFIEDSIVVNEFYGIRNWSQIVPQFLTDKR